MAFFSTFSFSCLLSKKEETVYNQCSATDVNPRNNPSAGILQNCVLQF